MRRVTRILLWIVLTCVTGLAIIVRLRYGGGEPYPDVTGAPILSGSELETVLSYPEPIGNVAVSQDGRGFFTVHPESRPEGAKLLEFRDGAAWPYPAEAVQDGLLQTPLGVVIDRHYRLWIIDHGKHGFDTPRLLAIDLLTDEVAHDHRFDDSAAPGGSFLQDLQVSPDGRTVFIADVSFWRKQPAIVVHDVATATDRRVLEGHPSVSAQDWIISTPAKKMTFFGGLAAMKPGIDGIAVTPDGLWLAYGAMSHDTLYRVPTAALLNRELGDAAIASRIEALGRKPLSDGLSADVEGGIWITDVEHGAVLRMGPEGELETWVETSRIRWADALSFGPDGWLYLADSAIPDQVMRSKRHIASQAPYFIFRFRPGVEGVPGH
jgi:sugar lactone lactonase YvrE